MGTPNKIKNTRVCKFKKNFPSDNEPIYKAGDTEYIHVKNVEALKIADFAEVKQLNYEAAVEKAKERASEAKKAARKK